ncbi:uncharacterized protein SCHCODRAFT_02552756 [Schizophyllum commune H4-8]|uniref:uncharacterized protein n=1 Tax=Schizophyllum commune (strain H4-8 / FGSC 9210) TaxID=578458 RepID=UPI0021601FF4|nr:uncharacterized protein SCHCODRAFT_02552756 [Schizophyllum commune H4-8]KAI5887640.1 hypothetical protein SCHCODRAFT_02552756 [Schizophyllum commune H4-8]
MRNSRTSWRPFPIHDLPNEIIDRILTLSIPKELTDPMLGSGEAFRAFLERTGVRDYPRLLNQVCRKWRTMVNNNATLWSYIFVCAVDTDGYGYFPEHYEQPLALSKGKPLSLVCILGNMSISDVLSSPLFASHASRMRMLCIHVLGLEYTDPVFPLFEKIATPALEVLRVYDTQDMDESWGDHREWRGILHCAPRLSELSLSGFRHGLDSFALTHVVEKAGIDWSRLTVLCLPNIPRRAYDLLFIASTNPQLQVFRCTVFGEPELEDCEAEFQDPISDSDDDWSEGDSEEDYTEEGRWEAAARRLRQITRPQRRAAQQAVMGPHVLLNLVELHVAVDHNLEYSYSSWRWSGKIGERWGMASFIGGLTTPALTTLTISARSGLARRGTEDDSDYVSGSEIDAQENRTEPFVLKPLLAALIRRSRCTIRDLSLTRVFISLPDLLSSIKLCHHIRSLHLADPLRFMGSSLLRGLGTHTTRKGHLIARKLRHLVIEHREQSVFAGFPISAVLDMVDARWPRGWGHGSDVAYVEVVHCPGNEYERGVPKEVLRARMRSRLEKAKARKDLQLVITELKQSAAVRKEIASWDRMETYM